MWNTFFDHAFDFSMAFYKFKMPLTLFASSSLVFSYLHHSKIHAATYNRLISALTTFELQPQVLIDKKKWLHSSSTLL